MSLLKHLEEVLKANGYDKLSAADQDVLRNVFVSGALACFGMMQSGSEETKRALYAELKEYTNQHRNLQVPSIN